MLISRVLEVGPQGPNAALQVFLGDLMERGEVDSILGPVLMGEGEVSPQLLTGRSSVRRINALLPLMHANAAAVLRAAVGGDGQSRMLAVLRPCEQRAVVELAKLGLLNLDALLVVGVDCLSTYEPDYWRDGLAKHGGRAEWLTDEALHLAQTGQVGTQGQRLACQLCDRPGPDYRASDVLIGLVGVPNDERLLILADQAKDARWHLEDLTSRPATERETVDREVTLWRLSERRKEAALRKLESLGLADAYPGVILGYMKKCNLCGDCIDACPQWSEELREALSKGKDEFVDAVLRASQRLASCSGCGMCQVHCKEGIPLSAIQRSLSQQIQQRLHYVAGRDVNEPLPWAS